MEILNDDLVPISELSAILFVDMLEDFVQRLLLILTLESQLRRRCHDRCTFLKVDLTFKSLLQPVILQLQFPFQIDQFNRI